MHIIDSTATTEPVGVRKVDASRGTMSTRLSSEWFSRPDDERYLNLDDLHAATLRSAQGSEQTIIDTRTIEVIAEPGDTEKLSLAFDTHNGKAIAKPSHWSFGQTCSLAETPAGYLRKLPAQLAAINLQYGLQSLRSENVKAYYHQDSCELRAMTGPDYGRIYDHEVVSAMRKIAGRGDGSDSHWKVPGIMDWSTGTYDPHAPITRQSTTLFASDRDVFMFLVDDEHPISIGTLADGSPDLIFRGVMAGNSEVGSKAMWLATFYLRGVCQNRCIWGIEGYSELKLRHSKNAPSRFMSEAAPALRQFAQSSTHALTQGVQAARDAKVAHSDDSRREFLTRRKFTQTETTAILAAAVDNAVMTEGRERPASSVWDMVQGITAVARDCPHQDLRVGMERRAKALLDKVA